MTPPRLMGLVACACVEHPAVLHQLINMCDPALAFRAAS